MPKTVTFEEALKHAKERRDLSIANAKYHANKRLAEQIKELMETHGKGVSATARGLGWSRPSTYELCERAGVDIKRTQNREEASS